jgi:TPR repeat protein
MALAGYATGPDEVEPWFWELVEAGDTRAMVCVGDSASAQWDRDAAARWYRRAADAGDAEAMVRLAGMAVDAYVNAGAGRAGEEQRARAEHWFRAAAQAGHVGAMSSLARITTDAEEEQRWFGRAFGAGDVDAGVYLADRLAYRGRDDEAEQWYRRAAAAGALRAGSLLAGLLARRGQAAEAVRWYRQAAESGDEFAVTALIPLLDELGETAEAGHWRRRLDELRAGRREPLGGAGAVPSEWGAIVATAVLTTALVPFVQTLVGKAAEETYTAIRARLRRMFREQRGDASRDGHGGELLIVQDSDPGLDLALHLWTDTPHEAIRALADLDLDAGSSGTHPPDRPRRVFWNQARKTWQVLD